MKYKTKPKYVEAIQWNTTTDINELMTKLDIDELKFTRGVETNNVYMSATGFWGVTMYGYIVRDADGKLDGYSEEEFLKKYEEACGEEDV